ncbi:polysaccharide biosynthesis protein [Photobacterium sp. ZSDE20]|uniref:Polysaccharide biosynthesis protein n=1 Tax=Photobacterium pectinilyticum TaxID=2906793 RepID=A0ABT1N5K7_9GAMM|nr:nucleoside-diphosphate sugar epimerase/dehydratase [Photobacterium sp. ZSDE20]MCQ1060010.1 polysaccharide biosynthesis protein [Photobacterium sp. ZSDE20]MDD1826967.1 polysaccharide biosynthesis protein [Photobacterium sp. ZSDE20]
MIRILKSLFYAKRYNKRIITITYDIFAVAFSLYAANALRLGTWHYPLGIQEYASMLLTVFITILVFAKFGMYRAILRYIMLPAIGHIVLAVASSAIILALSSFFFHSFVPRSVPMIYALLAIVTLGAPRVLIKTVYYYYYRRKKPNVFIYGAGATGRELAYALIHGKEYHPVVILDDDSSKVGQIIFGLRVHHSSEFERLQALYEPVKLLIAINNIKTGARLRLLNKIQSWPIEVQSVPSVEDIAAGKARLTEVRDLDIVDLLGRSPVEPNKTLMAKNISDKAILVTGAGGSIGSEMCRQIISMNPKIIILFELNEHNLYQIERELSATVKHRKLDCVVISALGSVQNKNRVKKLIEHYQINTIYHAAAYKHVPIVEDNIVEGIRNNVFGTLMVAEAAIESGVENFTLISTDKAVRPTNIMGASKRMAELVLQAIADKQSETTFTMVRFGNVLGSSGSVVPLFREQIRKGGPVTVTHPDITRYFMLIPEAAQLVIQAGAMGMNGQVFVLDMGEPVKILDLAKRMINLMGVSEKITEHGMESDGDIEITFTGLRPGEKLYEELLIGENVEGTDHPKIMTAAEDKLHWDEMDIILKELDVCCHEYDYECIRKILLEAPTGYMVT